MLTQRIKALNITARTIKLLVEKIKINLHELGFGKGFLDMVPKAQAAKENID